VGEARGVLVGLSRAARREHVIRAALEGIAHQIADVLDVAAGLLAGALAPMRADGGLAASRAFLALQADLTGRPLLRSARTDATTLGVAAVAARGAGLVPSIASALAARDGELVEPTLPGAARAAQRARYARLIDLATSSAALELTRGA
jgi:glycerol kinase